MKTISYALFIGLILLSVVSAKAGLQLDTKLSYMGPYIGYLGTEVGALAGLMDSNGHPVAGKTITYKLGFLPEVNEITDYDGIAIGKIFIPFIMPEGFYVMSVIFKGDEEYGPSFDKVMFEVVKTETYTIKITSGEGGTTEPSGEVFVPAGSSIKIIITPNTGKEVDTVLVDGVSVGNPTEYTFETVTANHTVLVSFKDIQNIIKANVDIKPEVINLDSKGQNIIGQISLPKEYAGYNIEKTTLEILERKFVPTKIEITGKDILTFYDAESIIQHVSANWETNLKKFSINGRISGFLKNLTMFEGNDNIIFLCVKDEKVTAKKQELIVKIEVKNFPPNTDLKVEVKVGNEWVEVWPSGASKTDNKGNETVRIPNTSSAGASIQKGDKIRVSGGGVSEEAEVK